MCLHAREVAFDSRHAPSNATSSHWIVGSDWPHSFVCPTPFGSLSIPPLKLHWLAIERPRFVVNCRNLSIPSAFSEDVYRLQVHVDALQINISSQDTLLDEVIVYLDVLGPSVEDWVLCQVNNAHIIVVEEN